MVSQEVLDKVGQVGGVIVMVQLPVTLASTMQVSCSADG